MENRSDQLEMLPESLREPARQRLGDHPPPVRCVIKTRTRVDVGRWLRNAAIYLVVTDQRWLLLADGPRPWIAALNHDQVDQSFYNHVTGQLVLAPAPGSAPGKTIGALAITPFEAQVVLACGPVKEMNHA